MPFNRSVWIKQPKGCDFCCTCSAEYIRQSMPFIEHSRPPTKIDLIKIRSSLFTHWNEWRLKKDNKTEARKSKWTVTKRIKQCGNVHWTQIWQITRLYTAHIDTTLSSYTMMRPVDIRSLEQTTQRVVDSTVMCLSTKSYLSLHHQTSCKIACS